MNALSKILQREAANDTRLGIPSADYASQQRRLTAMGTMTGTAGFRVPPLSPKVDAQGKTRGQRKRDAYATAMAKVSEARAPQFMHSAARRRAGHEATPRPMTGFQATMKVAA
ncbi:hypothetical protein [Mesorhizobium sp. DCY119]|uniref:hypothetical protein n=1 Tax=Mesorhizobium sp. DCY119 TaxID=2108445 RepID=UPI000E6B8F89|nr:hypothetical protein [Mesorhizobium sp. DCY119]RJG46541.1 hypothetical protein D3Y55_21340 [Mesorhizobium sp. DCY119]